MAGFYDKSHPMFFRNNPDPATVYPQEYGTFDLPAVTAMHPIATGYRSNH